MLLITFALFIINGAVFHVFAQQLALRASANNEVKDEQITTASVEELTNDTQEEVLSPDHDKPVITVYTVRSGDTLGGIAEKFNVSTNTIRWANELTTTSTIKPGQDLLILPVSGVEYTVKKGDTLSGIALKFSAQTQDILDYNDIKPDAIKVGTKLVIPGAEPVAAPAPKKVVPAKTTPQTKTPTATTVTKQVAVTVAKDDDDDDAKVSTKSTSKFINPIPGGIITQGMHDGNAIDFGAPIGTKVVASASGKVLAVACGRGYGTCLIINHPNGSQTLYAHLSKILVSVGDEVSQGETIALSGNTGNSTGPHLHYEERGTGARNTFSAFKKGTHF